VSDKPVNLLCFDLDGTLYPGNTSMAFYRYLLKKGAVSWRTWPIACLAYIGYRFSCRDITLLHRFVHRWVLSKLASKRVLKLVPEFIGQLVLPNLRKKLLEHIEKAREKGHAIALLSSSPDFLVNEIAALLQIPWTLASKYPISSGGYFSPEIGVIRGETKACWIDNFLQLHPECRHVTAYSDAMEDLPMLLKADIKWAVFPEKSLCQLSLEKGWELLLS